MEQKKETWSEIKKELDNLPGGLPCVKTGVMIAIFIGLLASFNVFLGAIALMTIGVFILLYASGVRFSEKLLTILCSALAILPFILCIYFLFW